MEYISIQSSGFQQTLLVQILRNNHHRLFHAGLLRVDMDLRLLWRLVWGAYTGKLFDLSRSCLFVEAFGIPLLGFLDRDVDEDLYKGKRRICVLGVGM